MPLTGDFAKMKKLVVKIGRLADGKLFTSLKKNLAEEALTQVKFGFRESRDPYGNPWAPLKRREGKPLLDTGRLRNSFATANTSTGFRIGSSVSYAGFHQGGTSGHSKSEGGRTGRFPKKTRKGGQRQLTLGGGGIPARPMVPTEDRGGLGPIWSAAFTKAAGETFKKFLKS